MRLVTIVGPAFLVACAGTLPRTIDSSVTAAQTTLSETTGLTTNAWQASVVDPRSFGVRCDGIADDTEALQAAVQAAAARGSLLSLPPCAIRITRTILLRNLTAFALVGHGEWLGSPQSFGGSRIIWDGDGKSPAFLLDGVRHTRFEGFSITTQRFESNPGAKALAAGFVCQNGPTGPGQVLSTSNEWRRVSILGRQGDGPPVVAGWRFLDPGDGRSTGLNEGMVFQGTQVKNFTRRGYSFEMAQSAMNRFFQAAACSYGLEGTGWFAAAGANFYVYGGSAAGNAVDFRVTGSANGVTIENFISEGSARFLEGDAAPHSTAPAIIINSTFNDGGRSLNPDGHVISWLQRSLVLIGLIVKGSADKRRSIMFDARPNNTYSFLMLASTLPTSLDERAAFPGQRPSFMLGSIVGATLRPSSVRFQQGLELAPYDAANSGRVTISGLHRSATVRFPAPEPDVTSWYVLALPDGISRAGQEIPGSSQNLESIKTTADGFTLTIVGAPGVSNAVHWRWFKVREGGG